MDLRPGDNEAGLGGLDIVGRPAFGAGRRGLCLDLPGVINDAR